MEVLLLNLAPRFGRSFDALELLVPLDYEGGASGVAPATTLGFARVGDSDHVAASFTLDAAALRPGTLHSLSVRALRAGAPVASATRFAQGWRAGAWLEARDLSRPRLVAAEPREVAGRGGSVVVLGVLEAQTLLDAYKGSKGALACALAPERGGAALPLALLGVASLEDAAALAPAYKDAMQAAGQLALASQELAARWASVPAALAAAAAKMPDPDSAAGRAALVLLRVPAAGSRAGEFGRAQGRCAWSRNVTWDAAVVPEPLKGARVVSALTDALTIDGGLDGGVRVTVAVAGLALTYDKASLLVDFCGTPAKVQRLLRSDAAATVFTVLAPPAPQPGACAVTVAHASTPGNAAALAFTYRDLRVPAAASVAPARVYADGGHRVVVLLADFPEVPPPPTVAPTRVPTVHSLPPSLLLDPGGQRCGDRGRIHRLRGARAPMECEQRGPGAQGRVLPPPVLIGHAASLTPY